MADKPLKSITFPGLADKYMIPEIDSTLTQQGEAADAKKTGDEISGLKNTLDSAKLVITDEVFRVGDSITQTEQAANYRITDSGVTSDSTRIVKVYPLGTEPIYIKSQDGIQYRSGTSASTKIKTILGAFDGWVYPYVGSNYVAISYETDATIYGAWESVSDIETAYKTAINNANAIATNGEYFFEVVGTSSSTSLYEDVAVALSAGDFLIVNFYSMEGATWSKLQVYGYDAQNVPTMLLNNVSSMGSYFLSISASYVKIRVRVDGFANPTSPKLVYGIYKSTDLLTLSGTMAFLRGKVSNLESASNDLNTKINAIDTKGYMAGTPITPSSSANGYRITTTGVVSDSTRVVKAYPIADVPLYVKTQDGYQYRSGTSAATALETVLGEYSGIVQPYVGANYIAISFETEATVYGAFKSLYKLDNLSPLTGSKINFFGDSFTDDSTSYAHVMADRIDLTPVYAARGGSAIVTDHHSDTLDAPSFLSRLDGTAPRPSGGYYTGVSTDADITIVFGGINDCRDLGSGAITMGNIDSTHDTTTFYGGLQLLLDRIIERVPAQFVLGVIPPSFQPNAPYTTYIGLVQEAEREVYRKYHIPFVDLAYDCFAMSDNPTIMALYRKSVVAPTNYHPNATGAVKICNIIQGSLESMIR